MAMFWTWGKLGYHLGIFVSSILFHVCCTIIVVSVVLYCILAVKKNTCKKGVTGRVKSTMDARSPVNLRQR